jgi:predicted esterase
MVISNFDDLRERVQLHFQNSEYKSALDLTAEYSSQFPEQFPLLHYWRICSAVRLGDQPQALSLLQEVLDQGYWYGEVLLRKSPSLKPVQGLDEFEKLVEQNREKRLENQSSLYPLITMRPEGACQSGSSPCPLLIGLHGNGSIAQASVDFWKTAANAGWLVGVPQSSQAMWKDAYVWDDLEISKREIRQDYENIIHQYAVDQDRVVLAGHSMGGEVAIWLAVSGEIQACGFIAVGPGGPFLDELNNWQDVINQNQGRTLRGYIIVGENDSTISHTSIRILVDMLNSAGIDCELEVLPGIGHEFVPDFEPALLRGLEFILP